MQLESIKEKMELAMRELYVAVVCDVLDEHNYRSQAMNQRLRPLDPQNCHFIGSARTIQWANVDYIDNDDPYGLELEVMDDIKPGDVIVHSTDFRGNNAPWGELMSTAAKKRGAKGCICDSQIRDCRKIIELKFPVFSSGIRPVDSKGRGRVISYDVPISCGEVLVNPRDIIFADLDGIVVIPLSMSEEILKEALQKVYKENLSRKELNEGKLLSEVYRKYGVL